MAEQTIYTDGSCKAQLGTWAWAWVHMDGDKVIASKSGAGECQGKGNTKAELTAVVEALAYAVSKNLKQIHIITDNVFVMNNDKFGERWKENNWKISNGDPCAEPKLTEQFLQLKNHILSTGGTLRFTHIHGHTGDAGNELADKLAGETREKYELDNKLVTMEACPKLIKAAKKEKIKTEFSGYQSTLPLYQSYGYSVGTFAA